MEHSVVATRLAQSVERTTLNRVVEGSTPSLGAIFCLKCFDINIDKLSNFIVQHCLY